MRTDQTLLCVPCHLRFSRNSSCPGCGGNHTVDLTQPEARRSAQHELERRTAAGRRREWIGLSSSPRHRGATRRSFAVGAAILALVLISPWISVRVLRTSPLVLGVLVLIGLAMWVALKAIAAALRPPRIPFGIAIAKAVPRAPHEERQRIRGRVRALTTVDSPLRGQPCVAFRVIGESFGGEIDDGGGVPFDLVTDTGETIRVQLPEASLDIAVDQQPQESTARQEARLFFNERGSFPGLGDLRASEGVILDGSEVEVIGLVREEAEPEGYRAVQRIRVARDRPEEPLVIRQRS